MLPFLGYKDKDANIDPSVSSTKNASDAVRFLIVPRTTADFAVLPRLRKRCSRCWQITDRFCVGSANNASPSEAIRIQIKLRTAAASLLRNCFSIC